MTVSELCARCGFNEITVTDGDREVSGAYIGDLLSWVMGRAEADCAWVTIMSNVNVIAVATLADVSCVILAEGVSLPLDVLSVARQKDVNVLGSELSAYGVAKLLAGVLA